MRSNRRRGMGSGVRPSSSCEAPCP
jgi:hypothetical protein